MLGLLALRFEATGWAPRHTANTPTDGNDKAAALAAAIGGQDHDPGLATSPADTDRYTSAHRATYLAVERVLQDHDGGFAGSADKGGGGGLYAVASRAAGAAQRAVAGTWPSSPPVCPLLPDSCVCGT